MKNLFVAFAAFTILFLTGCRENSFNDPLTGPVVKDQLVDTPPQSGIIPLSGDLAVPGQGHISYSIKGEIKYTYQFLPEEWDPVNSSNLNLQMSVKAAFQGDITGNSPDTFVDEKSEDLIYVSEDGIFVLEKTFPVRGSTPGINLVCRFLVTSDGVSLDNMRLSTFDDIR